MSIIPIALFFLASALVGCGGSGSEVVDPRALMAPGLDCTACHGFPVAGTVFTDAGQRADGLAVAIGGAALTTNAAGNFYTRARVDFPATAEVRKGDTVRRMPRPAPSGACNACHGVDTTPRISGP